MTTPREITELLAELEGTDFGSTITNEYVEAWVQRFQSALSKTETAAAEDVRDAEWQARILYEAKLCGLLKCGLLGMGREDVIAFAENTMRQRDAAIQAEEKANG